MNKKEDAQFALDVLDQYETEHGNPYVENFKNSIFTQPILAAADSVAEPLYNTAVGIDRFTSNALGSDPLLEPMHFKSGTHPSYDLSRMTADIGRNFVTRKPLSSVALSAGLGMAERPLDPMQGLQQGLFMGLAGETLGPAVGGLYKGGAKKLSEVREGIALDEELEKLLPRIQQNYEGAKTAAWEKMSKLVGKESEGGLGHIKLTKTKPGLTFTPEQGGEKFVSSRPFKEEFGEESSEEFMDFISQVEQFGGGNGKAFQTNMNNYLKSDQFKQAYGKEAPLFANEYKTMTDSMTDYLSSFAKHPESVQPDAMNRFIKTVQENDRLIGPELKDRIKKYSRKPNIENAYKITKEINNVKMKLAPGDIDKVNVYDSMLDDVRKAFVQAGEEVAPGVGKEFTQGNKAYAKDVAPFYGSKTIEKAAAGNVPPNVGYRELIDSIGGEMTKPARGYADIGVDHFLSQIFQEAQPIIGKADAMKNSKAWEFLLNRVGGIGTKESRAFKKNNISKNASKWENRTAKTAGVGVKSIPGMHNPEEQ